MECIFEFIAKHGGRFNSLVDIQDVHGDTALNLAARIGSRHLVDQLLDVGANPEIENLAGLKAASFGFGTQTQQSTHKSPEVVATVKDNSSLLSAEQTSDMIMDSTSLSARVVFPSIATNDEHSNVSISHSRHCKLQFLR